MNKNELIEALQSDKEEILTNLDEVSRIVKEARESLREALKSYDISDLLDATNKALKLLDEL
jgi:nucleoid DNA-binding protein